MKFCTWKLYDNETNGWDTECNKRHWMGSHVTPIENGFSVCPYCGNKIKQNTYGYIPHYDHYNREHRLLAEKYGT